MADQAVTVYVKPGCPFAATLLTKMTLAHLPHHAVQFPDDPEGAAAVRAHHPEGSEISPTVVVGERYLTNPSLREVQEAMAAR
jgi:mycoredoxin